MKTLAVIPAYNEKENIKALIDSILKLKIKSLDILVVDDKSPDGTWKIVQDISKKNGNVYLLLREPPRGRGLAGRDGFIYALKNKYDYVIEMDADFSHDPEFIPSLLEKAKECDVVLGSRFVSGGKEVGRPGWRRFITWGANTYIRMMFGVRVKDCNSGFRCFTRKALEGINPYALKSEGPNIVQEVLYKAHLKGLKICEAPITFRERSIGKSKLGMRQLYKGYTTVLKLKWDHLIGRI